MRRELLLTVLICSLCIVSVYGESCGYETGYSTSIKGTKSSGQTYPSDTDLIQFNAASWWGYAGHPYIIKNYVPAAALTSAGFSALSDTPLSGTFDLRTAASGGGLLVSDNVTWNWFAADVDTAVLQYTIDNWDNTNFSEAMTNGGCDCNAYLYLNNTDGDTRNIILKWGTATGSSNKAMYMFWGSSLATIVSETSTTYYCEEGFGAPTPTPTLEGAEQIAINLLEKYSNAILVNQDATVSQTGIGSGVTKTSTYGQTLYFTVYPGVTYWVNASRPGYYNYNQTYQIPDPPGIYNVYMEKILTPYENKSYAHFSVIDQTNGGLIPNAAIVLSDGQNKLTNSAGYCYFSVNNSTEYTYTASKTGYYIPASGSFNITVDTSFLVALQRSTGPTPTWVLPSWTPVTVPTTGDYNAVQTLSAALRRQNVQQGMDVWYEYLPSLSQLLLLVFIVGLLGLMAGGERRN